MKFSVIIATSNRSPGLRNTLSSLRRQTWSDFEVILVGESLTEFDSDVVVVDCPEANRLIARNRGIAAATGDVIAFIDDDAEADSHWLRQLADAYDSLRIGGAGGVVYDPTGYQLRHRYSVADRQGNIDDSVHPPLWGFLHPGGKQFVRLSGTNFSVRRKCYVEIGGFNEALESRHAETELCMRLIDRGYWLRSLSDASVYSRGEFREESRFDGASQIGTIPAVVPREFRPFRPIRTVGPRTTVVFVAHNIPSVTLNLVEALATAGHEIHLITNATDQNRVDYRDGIWFHRILPLIDGDWKKPGMSEFAERALAWAAAAHQEVRRIAATRAVDIVSAPVCDAQGIFCQFDSSLNTVLTLYLCLRSLVVIHPKWGFRPRLPEMIALEDEVIRSARRIISPSIATLNRVRTETGALVEGVNAFIVPYGVLDRSRDFSPRPSDGRIRVLSVGCLEERRGPDLLLAAAVELLPEFPELEFVLVGDDSVVVDGIDKTYRQQFEEQYGHLPFANRVVFTGEVADDELQRAYAECDFFCLPARCESSGRTLIEALSFGKPVVAPIVGGLPEIVRDEENGILVYPEHAPSLVLALRRMVTDAPMRVRMGEQSRRLYEKEFTPSKMLERTLEAYRAFAGLTDDVTARRAA